MTVDIFNTDKKDENEVVKREYLYSVCLKHNTTGEIVNLEIWGESEHRIISAVSKLLINYEQRYTLSGVELVSENDKFVSRVVEI